jgi:hypothetical protein
VRGPEFPVQCLLDSFARTLVLCTVDVVEVLLEEHAGHLGVLAQGASDTERANLFRRTAARFYRLALPDGL